MFLDVPEKAETKANMIPQPVTSCQTAPWQKALQQAVRDPAELLRLLQLPESLLPAARAAAERFPLRVPRGFVARMRPGDPDDPLLRQVLPLDAERQSHPGFVADPVGDGAARRAPGLLHKYRGRALLIASGTCAVHCRYCFRRHYPYGEDRQLDAALEHLARDAAIREVILSGGDPLSLSDTRLAALLDRLEALPRLRRLRIHTRQPVVLPERITPALCDRLRRSRLPVAVVIHANHGNEIDGTVRAALAGLRAAGVTLLNQSVLLRGVNDDATVLAELAEILFDAGTLPYYLHQLDPVAGAAHFAVDDTTARRLLETLRRRLPGYLVPRLVREVAGEDAKTPLV